MGYKKAMVIGSLRIFSTLAKETCGIWLRRAKWQISSSGHYIWSLGPLHFSDDSTESPSLERRPWALMVNASSSSCEVMTNRIHSMLLKLVLTVCTKDSVTVPSMITVPAFFPVIFQIIFGRESASLSEIG